MIKEQHWIAGYLQELPLSDNQQIIDCADGTDRPFKVTATVLNTAQLTWWIAHYGAYVEVLAPAQLREEFSDRAKDLYELYQDEC